MNKSLKSFTLTEIMIVVGIIMILAAATIPSMLRANVTANEANAIANLRGVYTAIQIYYISNNKTYPRRLREISGYISESLAGGYKSGYNYSYSYDGADAFHVNANPRTPGRTGTRYFYLDETNVIRYDTEGEATADGTVIE